MVDQLPSAFVRTYLKTVGIAPDIIKRFQQNHLFVSDYNHYMIRHHLKQISAHDTRLIRTLQPGFQSKTVWAFVFEEGVESWRARLVMSIKKQNVLVRFIRRTRERLTSHILKHAVIIARNRKDDLPDITIPITYTPRGDPYFAAAFAGHFKTGADEKDTFVVHVRREQTSQRVVQMFWEDYRWDHQKGKKSVYRFLEENKHSLADAVAEIHSVADRWGHNGFCDLVSEYLMEYMNKTLFSGGSSMDRLHKFVTTDRLLASYIWTTNFGTDEQRTQLVYDLKISLTNQKAFIRSRTVEELQANIERKSVAHQKLNASIYDDVPPHIWRRVEECKENLASAKRGVRVGFTGRYISSDDIAAAETSLKNAYREADRWIGQNRKKLSSAP